MRREPGAPGQRQGEKSSCGPQVQPLPGLQLWEHTPIAVTASAPFSSVWGVLGDRREGASCGGCGEPQHLDCASFSPAARDTALQKAVGIGQLMARHRLPGA